MLKIYLTNDGVTNTIDEPVEGCWINMVNPTDKELDKISALYNIDPDDLRAALDEEEISRIDSEDNYSLVLFDIPTIEERNNKNRFVTIPIGVIIHKEAIITVCLEKTSILDLFNSKKASSFSTRLKTRFLLQVLLNNAKLYLKNLRVIYKQSEELEKNLHDSTENSALIDMMELGKSLLYFTTSLKSVSGVLDKLLKVESIKKYPEDEELMEDVIIENKQALEMSEVYSGILNGMMDAYASIIANNMNVVMKFLAIATIILSIPNIITGLYGMNLSLGALPFADGPYAFWIICLIGLALTVIVWLYLKHKKMY
ncbi:MAG: magnesium transporter CorA family protein [Erysipelotrichaceae bacterium]|nr:magnesium transporter CorA family protein [Erysipelotrichaceae bacterium]